MARFRVTLEQTIIRTDKYETVIEAPSTTSREELIDRAFQEADEKDGWDRGEAHRHRPERDRAEAWRIDTDPPVMFPGGNPFS